MGRENEWFLSMLESNSVLILIVAVLTLILLRLLFVIHRTGKPLRPTSARPLSTLIVLGLEMLNLLAALQKGRLHPRYYIGAATDNMSLQKARTFESSSDDEMGKDQTEYMQIYRSREVGQSYITSVGTTLVVIAHALWLMIKIRPQVILCNGPGTCIPICAIAHLFKMVITLLCGEHSTSQKALFERFTAVQIEDGRSTLCAMAAIAKEVSSIHLCWLSHVVSRLLGLVT